ncbi:hypothetical protein [Glaciecola sp. KUL10]|uniref:hypothetical protein n=1 Tax=Glaciecola sp. (strain KUL10) TaxID=2161813 RepID=UPI000D783143|nr:hypothetical protein [Glaciecola sp. KUL10]GBL03501.1 hypothetical protein KUL10_08010 [Glaciecola sp. KUL10]
MKNYFVFISLVFMYFNSCYSWGNEVSDSIVAKFKPDLIEEYRYILEHKRPSNLLPSFIKKATKYWEQSYNNNAVSLSNNQCVFWIALSEITYRVKSNFSGDYIEQIEFLHSLLTEEVQFKDEYKNVCQVWINENIDISIIDFKQDSTLFRGKLVALTGVLYIQEHENFSALFLTSEHFKALDLTNAIMIENPVDIDANLHGKLVRIEGRISVYEDPEEGLTKNYLYFGRVIQTFE